MKFVLTLILTLSFVFIAHAEELGTWERLKRQARGGGLGGPDSVGAQLEEDRSKKQMSSRLPEVDGMFDPLLTLKNDINERYGLNLGFRYSATYQAASSSLTDEDDGAAGGEQADAQVGEATVCV